MTSRQLGAALGMGADTIRKDLSLLQDILDNRISVSSKGTKGYDTYDLKNLISKALGFNIKQKACIIGLGRLGSSMLKYYDTNGGDYDLVAAFDSSQNKIELMKTSVPLFPAYDIPDICREKKIQIAFIAVPEDAAEKAFSRALEGGVKGFINFTPAQLQKPEGVHIQNISFAREFRVLTAMMKI